MELDNLLPQATDLEEAILGAAMLEKEGKEIVCKLIKPSNLFDPKHKEVLHAILELDASNEPVDILTVSNKLEERKTLAQIGGEYFVVGLTKNIASAANTEFHCRIVIQKYLRREIAKLGIEMHKTACDDSKDIFDTISVSRNRIEGIDDIKWREEDDTRISASTDEVVEQMQIMVDSDGQFTGIISGILSIDEITLGWQKKDFIVVAARPSMGKTAFVLQIMLNAALEEIPVAIFSLEMSKTQLVSRLISNLSGVDSKKIKSGEVTHHEQSIVVQAAKRLKGIEEFLHIEDLSSLDIAEFKTKARKMKASKGIKMFAVDYLQLMSDHVHKGNREQEISHISRGIKSICKELDMPGIGLSQLSRGVENRTHNHMPKLSDLRESGSIEQDADLVLFLMRPEYYGKKYVEDLSQEEGKTFCKGYTYVRIPKHRNGEIGMAYAVFNEEIQKFEDLPEDESGFIDPTKSHNQKF